PMPLNNCRLMGKLTPTANAVLYNTNAGSTVIAENTTIVGAGNNYNPFEIQATNNGNQVFTNVIFTSEGLGQIMNRNNDDIGSITFTNCALPTDGVEGESLNVTEPVFQDPVLTAPNYTETATVTVS